MSSHLEIIEITYHLFCQHGDHLTLSQVAKESGIKKQSLYNYFPSKEALIQEMLTTKIESYSESIITFFDGVATESPRDQLYEYGRFVIKYHMNEKHLYLRRWITMSPTFKKMTVLQDLIYKYRLRYNKIIIELLKNDADSKSSDDATLEFGINLFNVGIIGLIVSQDNPALTSDFEGFYNQFFDTFWSVVSKKSNSTQ